MTEKTRLIREYAVPLMAEISDLPPSRERSLAITNIEQGLLWVSVAVRSPNGAPAS